MKIQSSLVQLNAQHTRIQEHQIQERLQIRVNTPQTPRPSLPESSRQTSAETVQTAEARDDEEQNLPANLKLIKNMIELLTGKPIRLFHLQEIQNAPTVNIPATDNQSTANVSDAPLGWGAEYQHHERIYSAETMSFQAEGVIKTEDGRELQFHTQLDLSWEHTEESSTQIQLGDAARQKKDPLLINYAASSAQLSSNTFQFDLDSDGNRETISQLAAGSAFLALDKNNNNRVDNGNELFGAQSGNGFKDLAAYDQDHNQWIDENDAIYGQLRLWIQSPSDQGQLVTLKQAQIGAIFLGSANSPFEISHNQTTGGGELKSSGIFLHENGEVGSAQQIDLYI